MKAKGRQEEVIQLLVDHEEAIGQLYDHFAQRFSQQGQFWATLAAEERLHAQWLKDLRGLLESGEVVFNQDRFDSGTIAASLLEIRQELARIKQIENLPLLEALTIAAELELRLIESKFYDVYDSDKAQLKELLLSLQQAFEEHRRRLLDYCKLEQWQQ